MPRYRRSCVNIGRRPPRRTGAGPGNATASAHDYNNNARQYGESMTKSQSLQDPFLNALRRERVPVSIYLVNGIKLQGTVESFDQFVILLRNTVSQMVYKHAISTVVPARNVRLGGTAQDGAEVGEPAAADAD